MRKRPTLEPTPIVFAQPPATFEQIAFAVNSNSQRVQTLQSRDAKLRIRGLPGITVDMVYEQPRRFRFRAGTGLTGQELDLGSNDELFWFWAKQNPQPAIYFARHDAFAASPNRTLVPVEPLWVVDAIGLPQFDPRHVHEGPLDKGNGVLEIRTRIPSPDGELTKLTTVNSRFAWVLGQQMFDARGRLLASSQTFDHEYYPHAQVALPRRVAIELPPAELSFQIETSGYLINQPLVDSQPIFSLPTDQLPNYPVVDLNDPRYSLPVVNPANNPYAVPDYPRTSFSGQPRGPQTMLR
jgi:hypothetical protein